MFYIIFSTITSVNGAFFYPAPPHTRLGLLSYNECIKHGMPLYHGTRFYLFEYTTWNH